MEASDRHPCRGHAGSRPAVALCVTKGLALGKFALRDLEIPLVIRVCGWTLLESGKNSEEYDLPFRWGLFWEGSARLLLRHLASLPGSWPGGHGYGRS